MTYDRRLLTLGLLVFMTLQADLLSAQCSGFWATVDTDPPYLTYCPGDTVAAFPIITGGTPPFTYQWSTGGTDSIEILVALDNGWYSACVTITDANGCVAFGCKHIKPTFWNLSGWTGWPECEGEAVTLSVSAGAPNTFLWSTGETTSSIQVTQPGTYFVTVTDPTYGCEVVMEMTPTFLPPPQPQINGPTEICFGLTETIEIDNPSQYINYTWGPNGETTSSIDIDTAGVYTVTVTDVNGCVGTSEIVVEHLFGTLPDLSAPPQLCAEDVGTVEVLNAGELVTFEWSTGATTASIIGSAPNTYLVTVTDGNGCVEYGEISIELFETIDPEITGDADICFGQESVVLAVDQTYSAYDWSTGETSQSIETSDPGLYTVTVTDANGCTTTGEHLIEEAPIPDPYIQIPPQTCDSLPMLLTVYGTGGPFSSYLWFPDGQTTSEIVAYESGTFSVQVTNDYGCTATTYEETVYVGNGPDVEIVLTQLSCSGDATLTALGGLDYTWSTGEVTQTISVSQGGTYSVTATDENGCTGMAEQELIFNGELIFEVVGPGAMCDGDSAVLTVTGAFDAYAWSTGATTSSIEVTTPGTYSVTVTDSGGCTGEEQITVETAPGPQPEITGPAGVCGGGLATLEITGNYSSIMWSTGETGTSINAAPGTYSVTVTNNTGCPGTDAFEVTTYAPASVEINGPSSICSGSAGTLGVAGAFSEMIWNTGATTPEIEVNAAGTYSVTVTDANGCTAIDSMTVEAGTALTPEVIQTGAPCVDTAVLDAGAGYDTYTWSNGMTTPTITVDASGMYFVTVTDATGCTGIAEAEVNLQEPVEVEITGPPSVCGTETAMLAATSGFASYAWSTGDTTASIMVGQTGIYQVVVTDTNGCTGETSIAFTVFEDPDPVISGPASICTGSDAVLGVGGTYSSIVWSTGATTPEITVSGSGSFAVTVTDANGCTGTETHTVQIADSLSLDINVSGPLCEGTAILSAGGGFASYVWSNGATTPEITVNDEGIYGVTVTDAGGCSGQASLALTMPDPVDVEILGPVNACAGADATLLASASQGQFLWSTGDTTAAIQVSASGNYSVTVTGDGGCTAEASTTFEILPPPSIVVNGPDFICTGYPGTLTIDSAYVEMQWSTGDTGDSMLVETGGLYSVTVTDANGCTAVAEHLVTSGLSDSTFLEMETCSVLDTGTVQYIMTSQSGCDSVITIHMMLAPSLSSEVSLTACAGESIQYDDVEVLAGESAEILYVASTGCDSIVTVIVSELPAVMIETEITPACADAEDGTIDVLMVQGTAPFEFWIDGQPADAGSLLTGLAAGSHLISVVDANGCSLEMPVEIPERARVEIAVEDQVLTCASPMAVLSPTVVGGNAGDVQWFWSTGVAQHWIAVEEPGTYSVSVDDGCGIQAYTINVTSAGDGPDGKLFYVPNAFSPNGDGVNDEFRAFPNPDYTVLDFELRIFDRWGNTLFTASDTEASWDGLFRNLAMEPGVYVWWLKATVDLCGQRQRYVMERGDVTVLR